MPDSPISLWNLQRSQPPWALWSEKLCELRIIPKWKCCSKWEPHPLHLVKPWVQTRRNFVDGNPQNHLPPTSAGFVSWLQDLPPGFDRACLGIMQVKSERIFILLQGHCRGPAPLWRLLQTPRRPLAPGTAKAPWWYCCFREIMATDCLAQLAAMWNKNLGLNKTRIWQLWDGTADVPEFPITPWLWKVSKSCCLQPAERAQGKGHPWAKFFPWNMFVLALSWSEHVPSWCCYHHTAYRCMYRGCCWNVDGVESTSTSHQLCVTKGGEWEWECQPGQGFPHQPKKVFILRASWYDRPPLAHSFFNLLWHLGLVYTGDLIQIVWGCEFRGE